MSKGEGRNIVIKFSEAITTEDIGASKPAFKVSGKEYKYVNGPLLDKEYEITSVTSHPSLDSRYIISTMDNFSRFPTVEGDLTVEYDASIGNLSGTGGAVESFEETFTPTDLVPEPNPNPQETIEVAPTELTVDLIPVEYVDRFAEDTLTVAPVELEVELIHTSIINP